MANQNIQQPNADSKGKAAASLMLGTISIVFVLMPLLSLAILGMLEIDSTEASLFSVIPWLFPFATPPAAILGLIFGILGLKSTKKKLAISGVILGIISLGIFIFFSLIFL